MSEKKDPFYLESLFPESDKIFSFLHKPFEEVKDGCIYVLDTNALLAPYFVSKEGIEDFKRIYRMLKKQKRLFIPARVAREFANNRGRKLAETYKNIIDSENNLNSAKISIGKFPILETEENYRGIKEIEDQINKLKEQFRAKLRGLSDKLKNWSWDDPVSKLYKEIFTSDIIIEVKLSNEDLKKNKEYRFNHFIAPGYKKEDQNKPDGGIGDYIVWQTTLEIGQDKKKDVTFVTGESHNDWFYVEQKTALWPKHELVDEFRRLSGEKSINIVDFATFLTSQNASQSTIDEVRIAPTGYMIISRLEFLKQLELNQREFENNNGFLGAKYFVETILAQQGYDIGSSWELFNELDGIDIEGFQWKDPNNYHHPLRAVRLKE